MPKVMESSEHTEIYTELVKQVHAIELLGVAATGVNATILCLVLWPVVPHSTLIVWYCSMSIWVGFRVLRHYRVRHNPITPANFSQRGHQFVVLTGISGIAWGSTAVILFPEQSIAHQVFITFVLGGMVAGSVAAFSYLRRAYLAFTIPALLPIVVRLVLTGDYIHVTMGAMVAFFGLLTYFITQRVHRMARTSLKLRFENRNLIQYLEDAKNRLEANNRRLESEIAERRQTEGELKQAYEELQETQTQLVQSTKLASIGELASGIAHELNQPLMVIRSTSQYIQRLIKKETLNIGEFTNYLEPIERNTKRMMNIINHLRVFSRQSRSVFSPQDVNAIIESALDMVQAQLRLRNIKVELNLASDLPKVMGDHNRLEQVFLNLITNARDAIQEMPPKETLEAPETEKTGGHLMITTAVSDGNGTVDVVVGDNGCGISEADIGKVFDPFFTTKPEGKGTGLGLSISYGIIKEHGGRIDVEKSGPDGTILRVKLQVEAGR